MKCFFETSLFDEILRNVYVAVTEEEITAGLLTAEDAQKRALCYVRDLKGIHNAEKNSKTAKFIDTSHGDPSLIDSKAQILLSELSEKKVVDALGSGVYRKYVLPWSGELLEESKDQQVKQYLDTFCSDFVNDMKKLIVDESSLAESGERDDLYLEVLHHAHFAEKKLQVFCGREDTLNKINHLLQSNSSKQNSNQPIIVYAASGYGKTSLMAKVASLIPKWKSVDCCVILRFLGTSPQSSDIIFVLCSVMSQLSILFGYNMPAEDKMQKLGEVTYLFNLLLTTIGKQHEEKEVVILLDSVDQLSSDNKAYEMSWLPSSLPSNIYIILSMIPSMYDCLDNSKKRVENDDQYIEMLALSDNTAHHIIQSHLTRHNRALTNKQKQMVFEAFQLNREPLFLKLVMDEAVKWNSFTHNIKVAQSVKDAIERLFADLESKYGVVLVERALAYLTCGMGGLTGIEMEDVLSCDDDVLNEVYKYHDPPTEGIVRIPSLLWSRLHYDLKDYMTERQMDGKVVLTWYHRQFFECAESRYIPNVATQIYIHNALAELYSQTSGITRTIVLKQRRGKLIQNADRKVTPQKLSINNIRKLNALPYHLFHAGDVERLKEECIVNFDFLFIKLCAVGVSRVLNEMLLYVKRDNVATQSDVIFIKHFIQKTYSSLHLDPFQFPHNIKYLVEPYIADHPRIHQLHSDAIKWLNSTKQTMFVPKSMITLRQLDSPLQFSHLLGFHGCISGDKKLFVCNWMEKLSMRGKVRVFDLETKDIIVNIAVDKAPAVGVLAEHLFYADKNKLIKRQNRTGDFSDSWIIAENFEEMHVRTIVSSPSGKYLAIGAKSGKPKDAHPQKWRNSTLLAIIDPTKQHFTITTYHAKKHVDRLMFFDNDEKLLCFSKERLSMYSVPDLQELQILKDTGIFGAYAHLEESSHSAVFPQQMKKGVKFTIYNYVAGNVDWSSSSVHTGGPAEHTIEPFGLATYNTLQTVLIGSRTNDKDSKQAFLWLWKKNKEEEKSYEKDAKKITLGNGEWRVPNCMVMSADFSYCFVGWFSGDVSIVDMSKLCELHTVHAHGQMINQMMFLQDDMELLTIAEDHGVNIWNVSQLIKTAQQQSRMRMSPSLDNEQLNDNEQVLDVVVYANSVITAGFSNQHSPKFWYLHSGDKDSKKTVLYQELYESCLNNVPDDYSQRKYHASLHTLNNKHLLYTRKRRNAMACFCFNLETETLLTNQWIPKSFFMLVFPDVIKSNTQILIQQDGQLLCKEFPSLNTVKSIKMPKITEAIPNVDTSNGKRRLMLCKLAVTVDGNFAFFINPSITNLGERKEKYFDMVDLKRGEYVGRSFLHPFTSWKFLENTISYYVNSANHTGFLSPSNLPADYTGYMSLVYTHNTILSHDLSLGIEIEKGNVLYVWDTLERIMRHKLQGHIAEVTCGQFSKDKRFLATGSYDMTVRLWSMQTGQQLCLFHTIGAIDTLIFSPTQQLIIHHYSAPQRKRACIMDIKNI